MYEDTIAPELLLIKDLKMCYGFTVLYYCIKHNRLRFCIAIPVIITSKRHFSITSLSLPLSSHCSLVGLLTFEQNLCHTTYPRTPPLTAGCSGRWWIHGEHRARPQPVGGPVNTLQASSNPLFRHFLSQS